MARTKGSTNKPKETLYVHKCKKCGSVVKTCIPNVVIGCGCINNK